MSTGTDVILCVILAMTREAWGQQYENLSGRKTPPGGNEKHDFKKGAKESISCCYYGWLRFNLGVAALSPLESLYASLVKKPQELCESVLEA